jgi:hypothetical protein
MEYGRKNALRDVSPSAPWKRDCSTSSNCASLRLTAALTASTCTGRICGPSARTNKRLYSLDAWRECPYYTGRERSALAWAEAVTLITHGHASDAAYEEAREHLTEKEISDLTFAIATINAWNRLAICGRAIPGDYQPANHHEPVNA